MSIRKQGIPLETLEAWELYAGPKSPDQWVDGRSAKEVARAWLAAGTGCLPEEVASLLASHPAFGPVRGWHAEPEVKLRFDGFPGEPRNTDILIDAKDEHGPFLIAVEAKADETFDKTIAKTLCTALERKLKNSASNGIRRLEQLASAVLGARDSGAPALKDIRYQLLTACAGVLCEAERKGYSRALMLVHEFVTSKTSDKNHARNAEDLSRFITRLSRGAVTEVRSGEINGPFEVPGGPLMSRKVGLFVGKVSRNLRSVA